MTMTAQRSIVIGGGAFAGLGLALALRQGLGAEVPIIVADPALAARPSRDPRATAIVAADVVLAMDVLQACWRRGVCVPRDLSVIALEEGSIAEKTTPPLTALRAPDGPLAHEAATLPGRTLGSIFFGGGTPSLMPPATVAISQA